MKRLVYGHGEAMQKTETHRRASLATERDGGHETETGRKSSVQSHANNYNCSTSSRYTARQVERGRFMIQRARQWRRDNPEAWEFIVNEARRLAEDEKPIAAHGLIESVRKRAFVDRRGRDTKTNNDFGAIFARWLILEHPEMAGYIERRRSVFDELVGRDG